MTKPWREMTDRERDAALATVAGLGILPYTISLDAMRLVERVIEGRNMQRRYLEELAAREKHGSIACDLDCLAYEGASPRALWDFVCATPAQRAEAAYIVLREAHAPPT